VIAKKVKGLSAGRRDSLQPTLIVFSGLPGSGKSSIASGIAEKIGAVWLRIDSIEQAIRHSGVSSESLDDAGYRAAYWVAEDNLRLGNDVVGDSVNPWLLTRNAWRDAGVASWRPSRGGRDPLHRRR
jgi:predicted kinase